MPIARRPACTVAVTSYAGRAVLSRHSHDEMWVSFVLAGSFVEEANGERRIAEAGTILVKPRGTCHANEFGGRGARILSIRVEPTDELPLAAADECRYDWRREPRAFGEAVALARAASEAPAAARGAAAGSTLALEERALALVDRTLLGAPRDAPRGERPDWLERVLERLADDPTLERLLPLARVAGVHPIHLARVFRRCTGVTMRAWRRRVRVARAVDLLSGSTLRLADVAQRSGFADQAHLCRSLRRELGTTPGALAALLRSRGAA